MVTALREYLVNNPESNSIFKGSVDVIQETLLFMKCHVLFTTLPLNALSVQT